MDEKTDATAKIAIWTAGITALATVLTAFIGIVPQMRQADRKQITDLKARLAGLPAKSPETTYMISGFVKTKKNNMPLTDAMLVAAPADNSPTLDDAGKFVLQHMTNQPYYIAVQTQDGKMRRVLISPNDPETDTDELAITSSFSKEE